MPTIDQLLDQDRHALLRRVDQLEDAIRKANAALDTLPWQGDGLYAYVFEGLDTMEALKVGQVLEDAASALDPETLGLKGSAA